MKTNMTTKPDAAAAPTRVDSDRKVLRSGHAAVRAMIRQAVFLVGGRGTRLGTLTAATPKPLLQVAPGVRILDVLIENAARHGFTDVVLLAGYLGEQVEDLYHGRLVRNARVRVVREAEPAGTGGALLGAADVLDPWFLLANGDTYFDINLRALTSRPPRRALGRIALRTVPDVSFYGTVELRNRLITRFTEKSGRVSKGLVNGGVYLLNRNILSCIHGPCSIECDVFPMLAEKRALHGQIFNGYFLDIGLPETLEQANREFDGVLRRPIAFLDRDGVLNHDSGYTHRLEALDWTENAREAVLFLNNAGYFVVVVTNQAGIARGFYTEDDVDAFHSRMELELAEIGAHIDAFYYCPFHPEAVSDRYRRDSHPDRKPNPGMIHRGMREWPAKASGSFLIGDADSDMEAARRAGIPGFRFTGGDLLGAVKKILVVEHPVVDEYDIYYNDRDKKCQSLH
jgi:histidinol-phosphate phosphatase family protein